jgi:tetratricopeptide (TPR) repeat protein
MARGSGDARWVAEASSLNDNALAWWTRAKQTGQVGDVQQAITLGLRAIDLGGPGHPYRVTFLGNLGTYKLTKFELTGLAAVLDDAIAPLESAVAAPAGPHHAMFRFNLGTAYLRRFEQAGRLSDLDRCIALIDLALAAVAEGPDKNLFRSNLSVAHLKRFERAGQLADLDRSIGLIEQAVAAAPDGPDSGVFRSNLGAAYLARFERTGRQADLDRAIDHIDRAAATVPEGPNRSLFLGNLGAALWNRFERANVLADLDRAIEALKRAMATGQENPNLATHQSTLGAALHSRFERTGHLVDLDEAIEYHERAVSGTPANHDHLALRLSNLGMACKARFERLDRAADLDRAIEVTHRAVAEDGDSPRLPTWLANLGSGHHVRFERMGHLDDLDQAVTLKERAVAAIPDDHPDKPLRQGDLVGSYNIRFERTGDLADVERAIEAGRRAVAALPDDHPALRPSLSNLGIAYQSRFEHFGHPADLDQSVACRERAVAATPVDHPDRALYLSNLGQAYRVRHTHLRGIADLDRAIEAGRGAIEATPADHPDRALYLSNLGGTYQARHDDLGSLGDLDRAVEFLERAVAATPDDHARLVTYLANLGTTYLARGKRIDSLSDVDRSVEVLRRAISGTPSGHPVLVLRLANLSAAYLERFGRTAAGADADLAVDHARQAVDAAPENHPHRAFSLSQLGAAHRARFRHTGSLSDVDKAIDIARQAIAATPADHPSRAARLYRLAVACQNRLDAGEDRPGHDLLGALVAQMDTLRTAPPGDRVMAGWAVGRLASSLGDHAAARDLLDTAVRLLPSVASRETTHIDQEHRLGGRIGLVGEAIAAHCSLGDPGGALEVAEHSRGILLATQLDSRTDLTDLVATHPESARHFREVRDRLNAVDLGPDVVERRARLWADYDALLAGIRRLPGLERFLVPPTWRELRPTTGGTVVLINAGRDHGDAVVIADTRPVHVPLPRLIATDVSARATELSEAINDPSAFTGELRRQRVVAELLAWLWDVAVGPVLDVVAPDDGTAPRVWWMPTGRLGLLPLHAAAPPDGPGALDRVVSSYTPTLRALAHSRGRRAASARRQVTVAMEHTPGLPDLPATVAEATGPGHPGTLFTNDQATIDSVLTALQKTTWAHFACHAGTNPRTPSEGALHLHDGMLPIARISRLELAEAELAYLSACSTGQTGWRHADEAIHLASAFQLAGFRHVIASLWPLDDGTAATAAERFYALMPHASAADHAPVALHLLTRELRTAYPDRPHLWAPLVHSGP